MRYLSLAAFSCYLVLAFALTGCDRSSTDPAYASNAFIALLNKGHYPEAFKSTAFGFQAGQSEQAFEAVAKDVGLGSFPTHQFATRSNNGKEAVVNGDLSNPDGGKLPLRVNLVKEAGKWRVFSILSPEYEGSAKFEDKFTRIGHGISYGDIFWRKIPTTKEMNAIVGDTMKEFNQGLHKKDFGTFYANTSQLWQSQTSKEQVEHAFKAFVDAGITIDGFNNTTPVYDEPPRMNGEGALLVTGYYPTKPNRVIFNLKYTFELPKWKLLGITISVKP